MSTIKAGVFNVSKTEKKIKMFRAPKKFTQIFIVNMFHDLFLFAILF